MNDKNKSKKSRNGASSDRGKSLPRRHGRGSFNRNRGGKRQHSSDRERNRDQRNRNVDRALEGRIWREESEPFNQNPDFMLDPSISSESCPPREYYDQDHRQSRFSDEMEEFRKYPMEYLGGDGDPYGTSMYNMNEWTGNASLSSMGMTTANTGMISYPCGMATDSSMYGMGMMGGLGPMFINPMMNSPNVGAAMTGYNPTEFRHCILVPPPPDAEAPLRREKPVGCKTVFVGGLPEKVNETIMREVFSHCGEITRIRMSRKNFCHIRFEREETVEQAMALSGYRLVVKYRNRPQGAGSRIHVDYAHAKDDERDYELKLRILRREERKREPSPQPIMYYSEREVSHIIESLKANETFEEGCKVLMAWFNRGDCNKKNAGQFYSMIQSTYSHVKKIVLEKNIIEDELQTVQQKLHQKSTANAHHFKIVEEVLQNASLQKVFDHFTKPQRKHIEQWKELTNLAKQQNFEDLLEDRVEDEMEMSDSEDQKASPSLAKDEKPKLQEEIEILRNQLQAANFEVAESKKKATALTDAYQLMQTNYLDLKKKLEEEASKGGILPLEKASSETTVTVSEQEARLVSLIGTFLIVHPFGASIDYICSYLAKMDKNVGWRDVENLLKKFSTVFKEEITGIGASLEKKWVFQGFNFYAVPNNNPFFNT